MLMAESNYSRLVGTGREGETGLFLDSIRCWISITSCLLVLFMLLLSAITLKKEPCQQAYDLGSDAIEAIRRNSTFTWFYPSVVSMSTGGRCCQCRESLR